MYPVIKQLQKSLGKKLRFVFRNFPLTQSHPYALIAAEAAEAAALQGKFWQMHKLLFENQEELEPDVLPSWAESIGVGINQFAMAIKDRRVRKRIEDDYASGVQSGVEGTPSFFINGMPFDGDHDFESLHAVLLEVASRV